MRNNKITTMPLFPSKLCTNTHYNNGHFCTIIWYNKSLSQIRLIPIAYSDICTIITRIASRFIFLASVYVPCSSGALEKDNQHLESRVYRIRTAYQQEKDQCPELELILTGDFNRWDTLWGGSITLGKARLFF